MNAFLAYANSQRPHHRRGSTRPTPPALTARRQEQTALAKAYHAARHHWLEKVLDRPEGPRLRAMIAWVRTLGPDDADELVSVVAGEDWLLAAPRGFRSAALHLIAEEICRIRREAGLPDEPDTAFLIIRRLLNP